MKRPSFQFYPADWSSNPNLKRCSFAEKGIWLEVMCLMHDQAEYGVLRWSLKEIAEAVKCKPAELLALVRKGVLKGADEHLDEPFIYTPRSGRKDGDPVTLVDTQAGPIWYSSRMVKDEHVRILRGTHDGHSDTPKCAPKDSPKGGLGEDMGGGFGPRGSSSSSSPSGKEISEPSVPRRRPKAIDRVPDCPYEQIVDLYHEVLPELPGVVRIETKGRKEGIRKAWAMVLSELKRDGTLRAETRDAAIDWFRRYFHRARDNDFVMGRSPRSPGHEHWQADLDFLMTDRGMKQVIEKTREAA